MQMRNQLGYMRQTVRGMSQEQLSRISGVSRQAISEIELNKRIPSVETALKLAKALKVKVEDIFILE